MSNIYHPSLKIPFVPSGYISHVENQSYGRYDVTKSSKEEVRMIIALCSDVIKQVVMLHDLLLIGTDHHASLQEKEMALLCVETFMIVPEKVQEDFYQLLSAAPNILKLFAQAVKQNVAIHSSMETESRMRFSTKELERRKKTALVMGDKEVVCLSEEQLSREKALNKVLSERFQMS